MAVSIDRARWTRIARNSAIVLAIVLVVVGIAGFFIAPGIVQSIAEKQIAEQTGRKASIGNVKLNPYTLAATLSDFKLFEADGTNVAVQIDELVANVSSASLFKRALVFDELRVTGPHVKFARLEPQRYSFSDIVDRVLAKPKSDSTFHFSLNNIRVDGGTIDFDDRVTGRKHRIDGLRVGVPFVSNLPYDTDLFVTPDFAARVNGSPIELTGKVLPFANTKETAVELEIADLDLPTYADFAPLPLAVKVASGKLGMKIALRFRAAAKDEQGKVTPQVVELSGQTGLKDVKLVDRGDRAFFTMRAIDVDIARLDPLRGNAEIRSVVVVAPHVEAVRRKDGTLDLLQLLVPKASAEPAKVSAAPASKEPAPVITIGTVKLDEGSVVFLDQVPPTPVTLAINKLHLDGKGVSLEDQPADIDATFTIGDTAHFEAKANAVIAKRSVSGTLSISDFRAVQLMPYLAPLVAARIDDATIDASAKYHLEAAGEKLAGRFDDLNVRVQKLRTSLTSEKVALLAADDIVLSGGSFDLGTRAFEAESLKVVAPVIAIKRDAQGRFNVLAALVQSERARTPQVAPEKAVAVKVQPEAAAPFTAVLKSLQIERGDVSFEDAAVGAPVKVHVAPLNFKAENVGTAMQSVVPFDLSAGFDKRGKLAVKGKAAVSPLAIDATVDASQVPVGWLAAYAGERLNVAVETADLNAKGTVHVAQGRNDAEAMRVTYKGSAGVSRLRALDRVTSEEFMRWKTLDIPSVDFQMPGPASRNALAAPMAVTLGTVSLADFYARVIVNATGRLNLQDVVSKAGEQQSVTTPESTPTAASPSVSPPPPPPVVRGNGKRSAQVAPAAEQKAPSGPKPLIRVAGIKLATGRVGFTDNFVKPNYSANLTDLNGTISALASEGGTPADVRIQGKIDGDGALDINGKVDPTRADAVCRSRRRCEGHRAHPAYPLCGQVRGLPDRARQAVDDGEVPHRERQARRAEPPLPRPAHVRRTRHEFVGQPAGAARCRAAEELEGRDRHQPAGLGFAVGPAVQHRRRDLACAGQSRHACDHVAVRADRLGLRRRQRRRARLHPVPARRERPDAARQDQARDAGQGADRSARAEARHHRTLRPEVRPRRHQARPPARSPQGPEGEGSVEGRRARGSRRREDRGRRISEVPRPRVRRHEAARQAAQRDRPLEDHPGRRDGAPAAREHEARPQRSAMAGGGPRRCRPALPGGPEGLAVAPVPRHAEAQRRRHHRRRQAESRGLLVAIALVAPTVLDYPSHLIEQWTARDGTPLTIRPIRETDDAIEIAFIASLSFEAGYQRLLSARIPGRDEIERFTHIDYVREMAFVAIDERGGSEVMCGVARYVVEAADVAAFAIVLADAWQGKGLGMKLMQALIAEAKRAGVVALADITMSTNSAMLALARKLGFKFLHEPGDATVTQIRLVL